MKRKVFASALIATMLVGLTHLPAAQVDEGSQMLEPVEKMSVTLRQQMAALEEGETIPVEINLQPVAESDMLAQLEKDYPTQALQLAEIEAGGGKNLTIEQVQAIVMAKREVYRQLYTAQNTRFMESQVRSIQSSRGKVHFISQYSPLCIMEASAQELAALEADKRVTSMEAATPLQVVPEQSQAVQATQAAYVKNTWGNKGAGVIIGMLEDNGMPVTTDTSELTGANIVCQT
nr:hypothetical protein [bacterium]